MANDELIFKIDISEVVEGLDALRVTAAIQMYCETVSKVFEKYAKENRPWTDRTSRARQGLTGYVETTVSGFKIVIAHTVDYGLWLELAHEKKYAILEPTVRLKSTEALSGLKTLFGV